MCTAKKRRDPSFYVADIAKPSVDVGKVISRFAIGVIATAADFNGAITIESQIPVGGMALKLRKAYALLILCIVAGVQFVSFVVASLWASSVVVKDDSDLATARLLKRKFHPFFLLPLVPFRLRLRPLLLLLFPREAEEVGVSFIFIVGFNSHWTDLILTESVE